MLQDCNFRENWEKAISLFSENSPYTFWGELDIRFYVLCKIQRIHNKKVLELASNAGVITTFIPRDNEITTVEIDKDLVKIAKNLTNSKNIREMLKRNGFGIKEFFTFNPIIYIQHLALNSFFAEVLYKPLLKLAKLNLCEGTHIYVEAVKK